MLKINCFLYTARVQDCKRWEAYLSMWESRKQPYLPLIKPTKTQYKEGGRRIRPARYTCRAINTTYSANPSVLEITELAVIIQRNTPEPMTKLEKLHFFVHGNCFYNNVFLLLYALSDIQVAPVSLFPSFCECLVGRWGGGLPLRSPKTLLLICGECSSSYFHVNQVESQHRPPPKKGRVITSPLETEVAATLCPRCVVGESEHTWTERGLDLCLYVFPPMFV